MPMGFVVFAILLFAFIFVAYKIQAAKQANFESQFNSKPEYAKERTIRDLFANNHKRTHANQKTLPDIESQYMAAGADIVACTLDIDNDFRNQRLDPYERGGFLSVLAITPKAIVQAYGTIVEVKPFEKFEINIKTLHLVSHTQTTKKASVVGRAAAGAAVAGGVGAVVGAVSAASANANGGVSKTVTTSNGTTTFLYYNKMDTKPIVYFAINEKLLNGVDLQIPDLNIRKEDNYIVISDPCMIDAQSSYEQNKNEQYAQLLNSIIKNLKAQ